MKIRLNDYQRNDIVRNIRQWTELKQIEFGQYLGKAERTIQDYEAGKVNYSIDLVYQMMEAFDLEITIEMKKPFKKGK